MKKRKFVFLSIVTFLLLIQAGCSLNKKKDTLEISIGYQVPTAQTWGSLIMKNKKLLESELSKSFPEKIIKVNWINSASGMPLVSALASNKIQFAFVGDMPALISTTANKNKTKIIAIDGKGKDGQNQSILVSKNSDINKTKDLEGKTVSVPYGSSAHFMLLNLIKQNNIQDVHFKFQDISIGLDYVKTGKVGAVSAWEPYPILSNSSELKELFDGINTNTDYLSAVIVNENWIENNVSKEVTSAFLRALNRSHQFIKEQPQEASVIFHDETDYPLKVTAEIVDKITFDSMIYQRDKNTFEKDMFFLKEIKEIEEPKNVDISDIIDISYLQEALDRVGIKTPNDNYLKHENSWTTSTRY